MSVDDSRREAWAAQRAARAQDEAKTEEIALKGGGGGGTSGSMDPAIVDAKIAASEARTDTKFAKLEGKLDLIVASLNVINGNATDAKSEARTTRRTIIGTGISLGALILAIAAFGVNTFTLGSRVDDIARVEAQQTYNQMMVQTANDRAIANRQEPLKALSAPPDNASGN
jgi:hypothetical protein